MLDYIIKYPPVPSRFVIRNPSLLATSIRRYVPQRQRCIAVALTCIVINLVRSLLSLSPCRLLVDTIRLAGFSLCRHHIARDYSQLVTGWQFLYNSVLSKLLRYCPIGMVRWVGGQTRCVCGVSELATIECDRLIRLLLQGIVTMQEWRVCRW